MKDLYLVLVMDGSDAQTALVEETAFDWIESAVPRQGRGKSSWREKIPGTDTPVQITVGSYENDRAIHLIAESKKTFDSITEAIQACYAEGNQIAGDYIGMSY